MSESEQQPDYFAQIRNLEKARAAQPYVPRVLTNCDRCGVKISRSPSSVRPRMFCSRRCSATENGKLLSVRMTGRKLSQSTREKLRQYTGEKSSGWKGGKPHCIDCGSIIGYGSKFCPTHKATNRSPSHRKNLAASMSRVLRGRMPANTMREGKFGNVTRGYFDIDGVRMFFRSKWEANYALYLNWLQQKKLIKSWVYEAKRFDFSAIRSGTTSYLPDFEIRHLDGSVEYHEVKGWMTPKSKTQLDRMGRYFPEVHLVIVDRRAYTKLLRDYDRCVSFFE